MKLTIISMGSLTYDGHSYRTADLLGPYIEKLAPHFDEIHVCASFVGKDSPFFERFSTYTFRAKNLSFSLLPTVYRHDPGIFSTIAQLIKRVLFIFKEARRWDLLYIFIPSYTSYTALLAARIFRKPFFIYAASDWKEVSKTTFRWKHDIRRLLRPLYLAVNNMLYWFEGVAARKALFVLVRGESLYERFQRQGIPVYRAYPMIRMASEDIFYRNDTCDENQNIKVLFVGYLSERKGLKYLIDAIAQVKTEGFNVHLNIVGIGPQENVLKEYTKEKLIADQVSFLGYMPNGPDLYAIYREADMFVLPTLSEGFPRVLNEAMGQSLPIIATNLEEICGVLNNEEHALLVPPQSSAALADAIKRIATDKDLRLRLIKNGQTMAEEVVKQDTAQQIVSLLAQHGGNSN